MTSVFFLELGVLLKEIALKLGKAKKSVLHAALVIPSSTLAPNLAANESGRGAHEDCQESGQDSFCPPRFWQSAIPPYLFLNLLLT